MNLTLESLGFSKEELQERVIDQLCSTLLAGKTYDEDGNEEYTDSQFRRKLDEQVKERINASIVAMAEKHVLPNVTSIIENLSLQETTKWGEAKGKPVTFIEYLVGRAEAYIYEQVDSNGKSKGEADSYSWSGKQTRITHLIHAHLHYHIEAAMKEALGGATGTIAKAIHETARLKLNEIAASLKVGVVTR